MFVSMPVSVAHMYKHIVYVYVAHMYKYSVHTSGTRVVCEYTHVAHMCSAYGACV